MLKKYIFPQYWNLGIYLPSYAHRTYGVLWYLIAICLAKEHIHHERTKYIVVMYHQLHMDKRMKVKYIGTIYNHIDLFTKLVPFDKFKSLVMIIVMIMKPRWTVEYGLNDTTSKRRMPRRFLHILVCALILNCLKFISEIKLF